jgi:hypothetical protein
LELGLYLSDWFQRGEQFGLLTRIAMTESKTIRDSRFRVG